MNKTEKARTDSASQASAAPISSIVAIIVGALLIAVLITSLVFARQRNLASSGVTFSIYPLYLIGEGAVADDISVRTVVNGQSDPHTFEPTPGDIRAILRSKVFVYTGTEIDAWAQPIAQNAAKQGVKVIKMVDIAPVKIAINHNGSAAANEIDPHLWLNIENIKTLISTIGQIDTIGKPANDIDSQIKKLTDLDQRYTRDLQKCNQKKLIVSHDAYEYLALRYGFEVASLSGSEHTDEVTPKNLATIVDLANQSNIKYLIVPNLESAPQKQSFLQQTGTSPIIVNSMESEGTGKQDESDLTALWERNLTALKAALECE